MTRPPIVAVVGNSGAGKTTLLEKLIAELTARGRRVAAIKHDAHSFEIDHEGKDSWRLKRAGATSVVVSSSTKMAFVGDSRTDHDLATLCRLFPIGDVDIVLTEGYRREGYPRIEVFRTAHRKAPVHDAGELFAIASDVPLPGFAARRVDVNDAAALADLIEEELLDK